MQPTGVKRWRVAHLPFCHDQSTQSRPTDHIPHSWQFIFFRAINVSPSKTQSLFLCFHRTIRNYSSACSLWAQRNELINHRASDLRQIKANGAMKIAVFWGDFYHMREDPLRWRMHGVSGAEEKNEQNPVLLSMFEYCSLLIHFSRKSMLTYKWTKLGNNYTVNT